MEKRNSGVEYEMWFFYYNMEDMWELCRKFYDDKTDMDIDMIIRYPFTHQKELEHAILMTYPNIISVNVYSITNNEDFLFRVFARKGYVFEDMV